MYEGAAVAVVIPAYNEAGFVGEVIETVPAFVDRVYVVDDQSTDGTWAEIRETLAGFEGSERPGGRLRPAPEASEPVTDGGAVSVPDGLRPAWRDRIVARDARSGTALPDRRFVALRHRENTGVGGAIKTGYRNAVADGAGVDVVAVMNGDGQMDPAILDRIIDPVVRGDSHYAKGNRLRHTEYRRDMSVWRTFGNVLLTGLTRIASGYWRMTDPQNGYTAVSREALDRVEFETLYDDYGFCNHLLVRLNRQGLRIADVPMRAVYCDETSHIRYGSFIPALSLLLLRSYLGRLFTAAGNGLGDSAAAAQLFGIGSTVAGVGVGLGALLASASAAALAGVALALLGLVSFVAGVALERRRNADLEVRVDSDAPPWRVDVGAEAAATREEVPPAEEAPAGEE
ncbi:glycosyltransferase family 2 protein [Halorubrum sp. 2020YC2]|uniref:glycosyltransferase family 2 protein n=1 Tax=Halorubrum sp. 2020YC2 TaxID=2836432 RepID=UPI001BE80C65|nr:glycosyltransferase family 2 protein [Halorubrum sp. 2020YC2]QWC20218.1 glycosyltransferase family 2 protein [Halorubrum sp. 2020YC2]